MSHLVKIKVQPEQKVKFPNVCVRCAEPALTHMEVRKRHGRLSRHIQVPLCTLCAQEVEQKTAKEDQWLKLGWVGMVIVFVVILILGIGWLPLDVVAVRVALALVLGLVGVAATYKVAQILSLNAASWQKRTILKSAEIAKFSWRATTFEFTNEIFVQKFKEINKDILMET